MGSIEDNCDKEACVCNTVRRIVSAQNEVANNRTCASSCEQSIKQLFSPTTRKRNGHTTIPIILFGKGDLKPFIANGIFKRPIKGYPNETYFDFIETPILKAKKIIKGKKCCVVFELLRPVNANGMPVADRGDKLSDFFNHKTPFKTINFRETGICITIDLNCFFSITCLDAITPLPASKSSN